MIDDFTVRKQIAVGRVLEVLGRLQKEYELAPSSLPDILEEAKAVLTSDYE